MVQVYQLESLDKIKKVDEYGRRSNCKTADIRAFLVSSFTSKKRLLIAIPLRKYFFENILKTRNYLEKDLWKNRLILQIF